MSFNLIETDKLQLRSFRFIDQIESNLSLIFCRPQGDFIVRPQKGTFSLLVDSEEKLKYIIENNNYPFLQDNESIYLEGIQPILIDGNIINKDSVLNIFYEEKINDDVILNDQVLDSLERWFASQSKQDQKKYFISLLVLFGQIFKNNTDLLWTSEIEYYFYPVQIPLLYNEQLNISLFILNEKLKNKIIHGRKSFRSIIIDVYCDYYAQKFYATSSENYFDGKIYRDLLNKDFKSYWKFPFVNIWKDK
jgi:hypothetical protein